MTRESTRPDRETPRDDVVRGTGPTMTEQRRRSRVRDRFDIPREWKQPGYSYEWKRAEVIGQDQDTYLAGMMEDGLWEPVFLKEMPSFSATAARTSETIIKQNGLILMKRPSKFTLEARREDYQESLDQLRAANNQAKTSRNEQMPFRGEGLNRTFGPASAGDSGNSAATNIAKITKNGPSFNLDNV